MRVIDKLLYLYTYIEAPFHWQCDLCAAGGIGWIYRRHCPHCGRKVRGKK